MRDRSTSRIVSSATTGAVIVLTTLPAEADGPAFSRTLVEERLAACASVLPVMVSVYRWKGGVEQDREQQLIIKTSAACVQALRARLQTLHPYDVPELLVIEVQDGSPGYLAWLLESVSAG